MNKQELIEKIEAIPDNIGLIRPHIDKKMVLGLVRQLDEPQKAKIPQFVADWIEQCKAKRKKLLTALLYTPEKVNSWVDDPDNQKLFARAYIDGYEVEKEKRYIVSLKNGQPLVKAPLGGNFYFNQNITAGNCKATSKELEDAGFGWVFDCEGIEIEEVE